MPIFPLHIRPSDCDSLGHVNNAVYVTFFEEALAAALAERGYTADWRRDGACYWEPRRISLQYRQPATHSDRLQGHLWLAEADPRLPTFGFEIHRDSASSGDDGASVLRAAGAWSRIRRTNGEAETIEDGALARLASEPGEPPRGFHMPAAEQVRAYTWEHQVTAYEVGPGGRIHPQVLYEWFEEGVFDACTQAGWPLERWIATGFVTVQTRHETEILALPRVGEAVRLTSQLAESKRLGGTWLLQLRSAADGRLLATDYSVGVHVSLDGRPAAPPEQIHHDIRFG